MRICLISREYPPDTSWGGIATYSYQHAHGLKELGHDVEVVALAHEDVKEPHIPMKLTEGIPVHRVAWSGNLDILRTMLRFHPYSHYVSNSVLALSKKFYEVHNANPFDIAEAPEHLAEGLMPAMAKSLPLVVRLHTPQSKFIAERFHNLTPSFDHQFVALLERMAMLGADVVTSPSQDLADYLEHDMGYSKDKIHIIRNPVDTNQFTPEGSRALSKDSRLTIICVGRLEERKGVHYLVQAMPEVVAAFPAVKLLMIGSDTKTASGHSSVLAELHQIARNAGVTEYIEFTSHVPLAEIPSYYRSADILALPSLYDNAPCTVLEAMSTGLPIVASSAGGSKEYVIHGESGLIVPPRDTKALAESLITLLKSPDLRHSMGKAARESALKNLHRTEIARQTIEVYKLAQQRFAEHDQPALYCRKDGNIVQDCTEILYAYHKMLFSMMFFASPRLRWKHRLSLTIERPRLMMAKVLSKVISPLAGISKRASHLNSRLEKAIQQHENEQDIPVRCALGLNPPG